MKRLSVIVLLLALVLSLSACSGAQNPAAGPAGSGSAKADAVLTGKIVELYEGSLLLAGADEPGIYTVPRGLDVCDAEGKLADASDLKPGQIVEIGFSGDVQDSYPAQPSKPLYIKITGHGDDLVGFYRDILDDLWNTDAGLNSDIEYLAFDLSEVTNLTGSEKNALVYMVRGAYRLVGITGTFDELCEQGYIDRENLYFENGLLFEFKLSDIAENSFAFDVTKWRGGLGAYTFHNCKAKKRGGSWSYTVGSHMIA